MKFSQFAKYLDKIELTSSRLEMTDVIAEMLKSSSEEEIDKVVYLALGRIGPLFESADFGISNKLILKAIGQGFDLDPDKVQSEYNKVGDLGNLVFEIQSKKEKYQGKSESVEEVFSKLIDVSDMTGKDSQKGKIDGVCDLVVSLDPLSAKYVVRIILSKLRLGFSDMTLLDGLSYMLVGNKSLRPQLENAYNVSADIGRIARVAKSEGIEGVSKLKVKVGIPVRPAAAERLPGAVEIIEKLGKVAAEPKIDGFRLQVHKDKKDQIKLYSRNLEDMSDMFPEIIEAIKSLDIESIIFEGEAVAYNPESEEYLPFQETLSRRRKYDIEEMAKKVPLRVFAFDLLYLNGESYIEKPYQDRRAALIKVVSASQGTLVRIEENEFETAEELGKFFLEQIEHGLEGIVTKRLDAPYTPGKRNFNWVKLKREEKSELNDSIDCVVMGYKFGRGKRNQFGIGAFLAGVYDNETDTYKTVCNVGTGLSDEQWREMKKMVDENQAKSKPVIYEVPKELDQDVWAQPEFVVEIRADEITKSPLHTAGKSDSQPGLALRFPRLIKWRGDKKAQDSTSVKELIGLYKGQKSRK